MKQIVLALAATLAMTSCAFAQSYRDKGGTAVPAYVPLTDCSSSSACQSTFIQATASAAINVSTATTTQIVALAAGQSIYVGSGHGLIGTLSTATMWTP